MLTIVLGVRNGDMKIPEFRELHFSLVVLSSSPSTCQFSCPSAFCLDHQLSACIPHREEEGENGVSLAGNDLTDTTLQQSRRVHTNIH